MNVTVNPAGSIGDFIYWDVNGNAAYNVGIDIPLPGVSVQLWQRTGVSTYAFTGIAGITDASGAYLITGLADVTAANAYQVRIVSNSTNELFTLPFATFTTTQLPSGGSTSAFTGYVVGPDIVLNNADTVTTNDSNMVQDFGFDSDTASLISGKLFRDWNGNGVQDAGDEPLVGFTVTLSGGASGTALTDANGFYQFINIITINDHIVTVTLPPPNHSQTLDPDVTFNSATTIAVDSGNAYTNRNFAYRPTGSLTIGDTLYYD